MKLKITRYAFLIFFALFFTVYTQAQSAKISIIPTPAEMIVSGSSFTITKSTKFSIKSNSKELKKITGYFNDILKKSCGFELKTETISQKENLIILSLTNDDNSLGKEGYTFTSNDRGIVITASEPQGIFYGIQTLLQLLPEEIFAQKRTRIKELQIPSVKIKDYPRFSYRGMHLDVCRHFMPLDFVKKYIDLIALHKMNKFHWHLTEDQGWRIEIKKYPNLQKISAYRNGTLIGHYSDKPHKFDNVKHGGYYTQKQIKEIIKYAQDRYVEIIPEIELPGHSLAALAAYPELSCTGGPFEVSQLWGIFDDVYCAGKENTFTFLENVLSEVAALFPSNYIHIGGDECPKTRWKVCPDCQARIKAEGLKDEHELQSYVIKRIEKFLSTKGKKIIGWDEILEGGLAPEATVMSWRGIEGGIAAANQNHDVIMTPGSHCYFDHYQGKKENEPLAIGGYTTLEKVYSYEPVPDKLPSEKHKYILGAQANLWTEYIKTPEKAEYMVLPRMDALAEVVWSPVDKKDYNDFKVRLEKQLKRYEHLKLNYSKSHYSETNK